MAKQEGRGAGLVLSVNVLTCCSSFSYCYKIVALGFFLSLLFQLIIYLKKGTGDE